MILQEGVTYERICHNVRGDGDIFADTTCWENFKLYSISNHAARAPQSVPAIQHQSNQ